MKQNEYRLHNKIHFQIVYEKSSPTVQIGLYVSANTYSASLTDLLTIDAFSELIASMR